jgi:hypothetical protein
MKLNQISTLASLALAAGSLNAATVVQIDFGAGVSPVQSGFTAQTSASAGYATDAGDITVASNGSFFNRTAQQSYTDAALMGDFTFVNNLATNALTLTINGAGISESTDYEITFYSYDSQHGSGGGTVSYAGLLGTTGSTSINYSNSLTSNSATATWTSDGSGVLTIGVSGTNEGPRISGMEITVVPEPSSFALLAGCFGLTWVMLRRRG